jgi:hypothetical protein
MMDRLFDTFVPPFKDDDAFMELVDALAHAYAGPRSVGMHMRKYLSSYGFDEMRVREAALGVETELLAEQFNRVLDGINWEFLGAQIKIELSRAAAYLHSVQQHTFARLAQPTNTTRLITDEDTVRLDGEIVLLDMTPERRKEAIFYLKTLLDAKGQRLSDSDVRRKAEEADLGEFMGIRWDQVRKQLPEKLLALIDTHPRKGSCLVLSPPPRRRLRK